jgi:hypothetical protein
MACPALAAARAGAQPPAALPAATVGASLSAAERAVADPRLARGLDAGALAAVRAAVADAAAAALPVEPLVARALAGVEAGAPGPRVVGAVRTLAGRLEAARQALAPAAGSAEVVAGADAIAVGVPASVLRELRRLAPGRSLAVPLGVVAQLVARGVPAPRAAAAVSGLVRRGATAAQLVALDAGVRADVASGAAPGASLDARAAVARGPLVPPLSPTPGAGGVVTDGVVPTSAPTGTLSGGGRADQPRPRPRRP